jgi:tRNA1(Val) A37 N6-methylase TrmN6
MVKLATTVDTLYGGRLTIEQPVDGYRFGTDAMLLAAAVKAKERQHVLELGSGVGAAILAAAERLPGVRFTGIERDRDYVTLFQANIERNQPGGRVNGFHGDVTDKNIAKLLGSFDHVMANPPFYKEQKKVTPKPMRKVARQEEPDGLANWIAAANRFLKPKGTFTIIHTADRTDEIVALMKKFCGAVTLFPLWPRAGEASKRIIIQGTKGSNAPLLILPGLVLHDGEGNNYTKRASAIIKKGVSLWED